MTHKAIRYAAWAALAAIIFVTVSPIGLRPRDIMPVNIDRAFAFAVLTMLFVLAYPRHGLWLAVLLVAGAGALELLQVLSPTRHARVDDATIKAGGAMIGAVLAFALNMALGRMKPERHGRHRRHRQRMPMNADRIGAQIGPARKMDVQSRMIKTVYFSPQHGKLMICFNNGDERVFEDVDESVANALVSADSPGKHYMEKIRHHYKRAAA